jgi:hypothetical protein
VNLLTISLSSVQHRCMKDTSPVIGVKIDLLTVKPGPSRRDNHRVVLADGEWDRRVSALWLLIANSVITRSPCF